MFGRAEIQRTMVFVVALLVTAGSTATFAREFRASDTIRAFGASPMELRYGRVLTDYAPKLIDGADHNWPSFVMTDHCKHARCHTLTEHIKSPAVPGMSLKPWQGLPADGWE